MEKLNAEFCHENEEGSSLGHYRRISPWRHGILQPKWQAESSSGCGIAEQTGVTLACRLQEWMAKPVLVLTSATFPKSP